MYLALFRCHHTWHISVSSASHNAVPPIQMPADMGSGSNSVSKAVSSYPERRSVYPKNPWQKGGQKTTLNLVHENRRALSARLRCRCGGEHTRRKEHRRQARFGLKIWQRE
eukprot:5243555-Pleurochrysis_carterae.AAC.1